jgi:hypothetical protein
VEASEQPAKYTHLDSNSNLHGASSSSSASADVMLCSLPPHRQALAFPTYEAYEVHYAQAHVNRCLECGSNFPTAHYLALHIAENHDPLNEARKARGEKIVRETKRKKEQSLPSPLLPTHYLECPCSVGEGIQANFLTLLSLHTVWLFH